MNSIQNTLDDDELIRDTLAGKSDAFGVLVQKHQPALFSLALRMLGNREEAEDVTQQVFVEAYRHLAGFRHGSQFSTWLYSITLNRARNQLRTRKNRRWVAIDGGPPDEDNHVPLQLTDPSPTPEQKAEKQFDLEWIQQEVKTLSEENQMIFTLYYFQNLPLQEIAKRLGRPVGTIKVYLHRARKEIYSRSQKAHRMP